MFSDFIQILQSGLKQELPGMAAQQKMSPSLRYAGKGFPENKINARDSGVLILLYPKDGKAWTVLIERNKYNGAHSGQIGLPGGKKEDTDLHINHTALREANEEIGVDPNTVQVLGRLTPLYVPVSSFMIHPVVGYSETIPDFVADPKEVHNIIEVSIDSLFDPAKSKIEDLTIDGLQIVSPYFEVGQYHVWGATAMILSEFREISLKTNLQGF